MGRKFSLALILELAIALVAFSMVHRSFVTASSNPTNPAEQSYLRLISNSISGKPYKATPEPALGKGYDPVP